MDECDGEQPDEADAPQGCVADRVLDCGGGNAGNARVGAPVPAGRGRTSFVDVRDIAESAAAALSGAGFDGRAFELTGPEALDYAQAAQVLSTAVGRPVRYRPVTPDEFVGLLTRAGLPDDYARHLADLFAPVPGDGTAAVTDAVRTLTGHPARSLAVYAADNRAALAG